MVGYAGVTLFFLFFVHFIAPSNARFFPTNHSVEKISWEKEESIYFQKLLLYLQDQHPHDSSLHHHEQQHPRSVRDKNMSYHDLLCETDPDRYPGLLSKSEFLLETLFQSSFNRPPTMNERNTFYNLLKTGEISANELYSYLAHHHHHHHQGQEGEITSLTDWEGEHPWNRRLHYSDKVYTWTVDFHPSPAACNFAIYESINVILHAEIDHHPFCEFSGVCKSRLQGFGLGSYTSGFALDPNHEELKKQFHELYVNHSEFQRIDVFMCSHPAANCELFEAFQKPMILFFTTRLEFGRNDMNIGWRVQEARKYHNGDELPYRQQEWIEFIHRYSATNSKQHRKKRIEIVDNQGGDSQNNRHRLLYLVANNRYDQEYVYYFTGLVPRYIPSWCGDADSSFGLKSSWKGCLINNSIYQPKYLKTFLIVPYKQSLWVQNHGINQQHRLYLEFQQARAEIFQKYHIVNELQEEGITFPKIIHSGLEISNNHRFEMYKQYAGLVFIPYQTSVMSFFEFYRLNLPIFAPSLSLLVEWNQEYEMIQGRIYGWPNRELRLIKKFICENFPEKCSPLLEDSESSSSSSSSSSSYVANSTNLYLSPFALDPSNNGSKTPFYHSPYLKSIRHNYTFETLPSPNTDAKDLQANEYWLQFTDIYQFPYIQYFHNWTHLYEIILHTNVTEISRLMSFENKKQKIQIAEQWDEIFKEAVPHRHRGSFHFQTSSSSPDDTNQKEDGDSFRMLQEIYHKQPSLITL